MNLMEFQEQQKRERDVPAIVVTKIWTVYTPDNKDPTKLTSEDWVTWVKTGVSIPSDTSDKVARLMENKEKGRPAALEWMVIGPIYEKWKETQTIEVEGTPLSAWPGCTTELAESLRNFNVHTVEDFVSMPDHSRRKIPHPSMEVMVRNANAFLTAQKDTSEITSSLAERDAKIAQQSDELEDLKEKLEQLTAHVQKQEQAKRGPGRPRKEQAE